MHFLILIYTNFGCLSSGFTKILFKYFSLTLNIKYGIICIVEVCRFTVDFNSFVNGWTVKRTVALSSRLGGMEANV